MAKTTETKNTTQVALRVPRALLAKIDAQRGKQDKTRTDFILEIVEAAIEHGKMRHVASTEPNLKDQVQAMARHMEELARRLDKMEAQSARPQQTLPAEAKQNRETTVSRDSLSRSAKRISLEPDADGWMVPMAAWIICGGAPREDATLPNQNTNPRAKPGDVIYTNWRKSKAPAFREWGFEMDEERKKEGKPWLRRLPSSVENSPQQVDPALVSQT